MTKPTLPLIYETLKSINKSQGELKATLVSHTRQLIRIRAQLNDLHSGSLDRKSQFAEIGERLDRIEAKLHIHRDSEGAPKA